MQATTYDLLILGSGINGASIANQAAQCGLSVLLCDKGDIASGTSSWSTKLIHGGLRYLEHYEFQLVREALKEREILMQKAPFLIHPQAFILPHEPHLRPAWMIQAGLFLYDHLAKRNTLPASKKISLTHSQILKPQFKTAFQFYDCKTEDSRLTLLNALQAKQFGATVLLSDACQKIMPTNSGWLAQFKKNQSITARCVINATGPWAEMVLNEVFGHPLQKSIRLVKGSHIITRQLYAENHAYMLQNKDQRIVFTIPYQKEFTLIGTTDIDYTGDLDAVKITPEEIDYLCHSVNTYFRHSITQQDIVSSFSGVRALYDNHAENASKTTREFHLDVSMHEKLPLLSIYGGKLTTHRLLAEAVLKKIKPYFQKEYSPIDQHLPLPGGDLDGLNFSDFQKSLKIRYPFLKEDILTRYAENYGSLTHLLLKNITQLSQMGRYFGAGLYEQELLYWQQFEWATNLEDMLWRRSKLGLVLTTQEQLQLQEYLHDQ